MHSTYNIYEEDESKMKGMLLSKSSLRTYCCPYTYTLDIPLEQNVFDNIIPGRTDIYIKVGSSGLHLLDMSGEPDCNIEYIYKLYI